MHQARGGKPLSFLIWIRSGHRAPAIGAWWSSPGRRLQPSVGALNVRLFG